MAVIATIERNKVGESNVRLCDPRLALSLRCFSVVRRPQMMFRAYPGVGCALVQCCLPVVDSSPEVWTCSSSYSSSGCRSAVSSPPFVSRGSLFDSSASALWRAIEKIAGDVPRDRKRRILRLYHRFCVIRASSVDKARTRGITTARSICKFLKAPDLCAKRTKGNQARQSRTQAVRKSMCLATAYNDCVYEAISKSKSSRASVDGDMT